MTVQGKALERILAKEGMREQRRFGYLSKRVQAKKKMNTI